jgi:lipid-A-disaccharide synthase
MTAPLRLFLIAGEASGDVLGAGLIRALRARAGRPIEVFGVGGPKMAAEGLESLFDIADLGVIGVAEIIPRLRTLVGRINQTADAVVAARPDALITIDSPGFTLRVAPKVRKRAPGVSIIHYVAPSVWAWRPKRARLMAAYVDHVLALLPFEPPFMTREGMTCDFVGHPVVEAPRPDQGEMEALRGELGVAPGESLIAVLPGSRRSEVRRLAPVFGAALRLLLARRPGLRVVVPAAGGVAALVREAVANWPGDPILLDPTGLAPGAAERRKLTAFAAADVALAASGTVTLELAAMGTPHVSAYITSPVTSFVVERLIKVPSANLLNLLTEAPVAPEFLQRYCTPEALAGAVERLLGDEAARSRQLAAAAQAMEMLGRGGEAPSVRAADSVLRKLNLL